ncbi:Ankyrin repeat protein [Madurella fahalii]|uniref:Ankyrin repeat protein n=1 Tax=Madurella fahalii TaxID=1157608 RepID=A0ABQ0G1H8_9PEZI
MASRTANQEEHEGASTRELLIEACRRNNTDLLTEILSSPPLADNEEAAADLLNNTTTVLGNHLYHEAASRGNYEVIDLLLDQPGFECDPVSRAEGDTPLHSAIRWINSEPPAQREFGNALVEMMLEAGSNPRVKNKGGLTPLQLVDPRNEGLRELIRKHEYATLNAGDFVGADEVKGAKGLLAKAKSGAQGDRDEDDDDNDDNAEFSGSDDEERAEWERRRQARRG